MPPKRKQAPASKSKAKDEAAPRKPSDSDLNEDQQRTMLRYLVDKAPAAFSTADKVVESRGKQNHQLNLFDHIVRSKDYTPFQVLSSCILFSKPLSSRLATRTLAMFYEEGSGSVEMPGKMRDAGTHGLWDRLDKARTQHKDKTATQLHDLAEMVIEKYAQDENDTSLDKLRAESGDDVKKLQQLLKNFNGIGEVGAQIFFRRMQTNWDFLYPFADDRCLAAATHFNLQAETADELSQSIAKLLPKDSKDEERKQFSLIVDALIAADLEHRLDDLIDVAEGGDLGEKEADEPDSKRQKTE